MAIGLIVGIILVFIGSFIVYGIFMIYFPEWVGITGKTALDYEKSHQEGSTVQADDDLVDRIQKPNRT
jgi:predicted RND superfamily exporter protein